MTQADFAASLRELIAVALQTGPKSEATERGVGELSGVYYATSLLSEHYREALTWILAEPYGCPFCDSGKLRNPEKEHDEKCGFAKAEDLLGSTKEPQ